MENKTNKNKIGKKNLLGLLVVGSILAAIFAVPGVLASHGFNSDELDFEDFDLQERIINLGDEFLERDRAIQLGDVFGHQERTIIVDEDGFGDSDFTTRERSIHLSGENDFFSNDDNNEDFDDFRSTDRFISLDENGNEFLNRERLIGLDGDAFRSINHLLALDGDEFLSRDRIIGLDGDEFLSRDRDILLDNNNFISRDRLIGLDHDEFIQTRQLIALDGDDFIQRSSTISLDNCFLGGFGGFGLCGFF